MHGASAAPLAEERENTDAGLFRPSAGEAPRILPAELVRQLAEDEAPLVLVVRSRSPYEHDRAYFPGSLRVLPHEVAAWAATPPREGPIVTYCTDRTGPPAPVRRDS